MFGNDNNHQDDQQHSDTPAVTPAFPASAPSSDQPFDASAASTLPSVPVPPTEDQLAASAPTPSDENPTLDSLAKADTPDDVPAPPAPPAAPSDSEAGGDDLLALKSEALQQLSPLVGQLEQTPEEKFKTTMMMIQAADDKSMIKVAYEAAQAITDEKVKAQALLDVINEINYFTQKPGE